MFLPVESDTALADTGDFLQERCDRTPFAAACGLDQCPETPTHFDFVEERQAGLAVCGRVERKDFADRRHRPQPVSADNLIVENEMIAAQDREVDGFAGGLRKSFQMRVGKSAWSSFSRCAKLLPISDRSIS